MNNLRRRINKSILLRTENAWSTLSATFVNVPKEISGAASTHSYTKTLRVTGTYVTRYVYSDKINDVSSEYTNSGKETYFLIYGHITDDVLYLRITRPTYMDGDSTSWGVKGISLNVTNTSATGYPLNTGISVSDSTTKTIGGQYVSLTYTNTSGQSKTTYARFKIIIKKPNAGNWKGCSIAIDNE